MTNTSDRQPITQSVLNMFLLRFERYHLNQQESSDDKRTFLSRLKRAAQHRVLLAEYTLYRYLFYFAKDRKVLLSNYWGRNDGFEQAINMFEMEEALLFKAFADFYKLLQDFLQEHKDHPTNILELGCGAGQWVMRLDLPTKNVVYSGIDINPQSIEWANKHFVESGNIDFVSKDISELSNIGSFDLVMVCQVFFFIDRITVARILSEIRSGTTIILAEPVNRGQVKNGQTTIFNSKTSIGFSHDYASLLDDAGFEIVTTSLAADFNPNKTYDRLTIHAQKT